MKELNPNPQDVGSPRDAEGSWKLRVQQMTASITKKQPDEIDKIFDRMEGTNAEDQSQDESREETQSSKSHARMGTGETQKLVRQESHQPKTSSGHSTERGPTLLTFEAKTKGDLDKQVKKATKGKTVISRTDRIVYQSVVVIE